MRDDYKISGQTTSLEVSIETNLVKTLKEMEKHTHLSISEMTNTALKNFVSRHSDFLPPRAEKSTQ